MIWYYLAGFISGAVGMIMYAHWWMRRHTVVRMEKPKDDIDELIEVLKTREFKDGEEIIRYISGMNKKTEEKTHE